MLTREIRATLLGGHETKTPAISDESLEERYTREALKKIERALDAATSDDDLKPTVAELKACRITVSFDEEGYCYAYRGTIPVAR